ncbi:ATP-binding cassette domain-containing protein [Variovorax sp. J31P207]|uniref:ATP-binding cassette domain-containing protein n=1 Tax=Variovorax sp. J31P207 TaxID=3053510 RepID=UPI002576A4BA|nr:ATP-binding cassette domain-containing protein [Variovorax sp. J31P207]MDM0069962.1 ATP-binding cassette domain-containing protein [Variovorax sp. J31P207]
MSIDIPQRGGVAILGRNGAGKTTLMKSIMGELSPKGRVRFEGCDITGFPAQKRVLAGIAYVPQEHAVFSQLSVRDNLRVGALANRDKQGVDRVVAMFPKLGSRFEQAAGTLSGGERKMLAIARALLSNPRLLLLDEPTEGVWIGVIEEIADRLAELAKEIAVVIVEQHLDLAFRVADAAYVLDRGRVGLCGASAEVRHHPTLTTLLAP